MTKTLLACFTLSVMLLGACTSSGPKTQFYSLFPHGDVPKNTLADPSVSFGVGPIRVPEYVDHPGIVSLSDSNKVVVSGYNAWAGNVKDNISRVIAANLSNSFEIDQVWAFPWDNRVRPMYQLRLVFEEFSGIKAGDVRVVVRWNLLNKSGKKVLLMQKESFTVATQAASYDAYVAALNNATHELSNAIAAKVATFLNPQ